mgnify:FL=1
MMKKVAVILMLVSLLGLSSCHKQKTCRCAVAGYQTIRLIQIDGGDCEKIRFVYYDNAGGLIEKDQDLTDSVLCTDYFFDNETDPLAK